MAENEVKPGISFGFLKKKDNIQLLKNKFQEETKEETDFVLSIEKNEIQSSVPKQKKAELVIPLITKNKWRLPPEADGKSKDAEGNSTLEAQAIKEILEESGAAKQAEEEGKTTMVIPLFMQNKIPEGYECDEKLDVSLRAEIPTLDDYEQIPIEEYGVAMLRGMGWKPGAPIGETNKQFVQPIEPVFRPKGLGLGADRKAVEKITKAEIENDSPLGLVKGAYVVIEKGSHKNHYGQIEGHDSDTARVLVKLAISGKIATVSQYAVKEVNRKEYKRYGKVINKNQYEEYESQKTSDNSEKSRSPVNNSSRRTEEESSNNRERRDDKDLSSSDKSKSRKRKHDDRVDNEKESSSRRKTIWIRPQLRVRFINDHFKKGQYFNTKVIIIDVLGSNSCMCETSENHLLEDIPQDWLETVIPRSDPAYVMIVKGKYTGKVAQIIDKDKSRCEATVQLLQSKSTVKRLDFDSICEYVGDITASEDF